MARLIDLAEPALRRVLADTLGSGGVVIMPCDTIYGILGAAPETDTRIRAAKGRGEIKPFIQLIADIDWLPRMATRLPGGDLLRLWPGPLTLLLPSTSGETVGVRLPDDELLRAVMRDLGKPLYSTSVNLSGSPALTGIREIVDVFGDRVDLIVDGGDRASGIASTIVDASVFPHRIVRQGALRVPPEVLGAPPGA